MKPTPSFHIGDIVAVGDGRVGVVTGAGGDLGDYVRVEFKNVKHEVIAPYCLRRCRCLCAGVFGVSVGAVKWLIDNWFGDKSFENKATKVVASLYGSTKEVAYVDRYPLMPTENTLIYFMVGDEEFALPKQYVKVEYLENFGL